VERVLQGFHITGRLFRLRHLLVEFVRVAKTFEIGSLGRFAFFDVSVYTMFRWD